MVRQSIRQARCTNCDSDDDNYNVRDKEFTEDDDNGVCVEYDVYCRCGENATITVSENGIHSSDNVSHEDASWNKEQEESDDE
jgi:hypothetical protein